MKTSWIPLSGKMLFSVLMLVRDLVAQSLLGEVSQTIVGQDEGLLVKVLPTQRTFCQRVAEAG